MPTREELTQVREKRKPNWLYATPLLFAPYFPMVRIAFRNNPVLRDRLFYGGLAVGLLHGTYLIKEAMGANSE